MSDLIRADEINRLHEELSGLARTSLETAIKIGGLLAEKKAELKHGEWLPWCRENLRFDVRTAQKYLKLNEHKNEVTSHLGIEEAYRLLSSPDESEEDASEGDDLDSFTCDCGEVFSEAVWHCENCGHHWPITFAVCGNCFSERSFLSNSPPSVEYFADDDDEEVEDEGETSPAQIIEAEILDDAEPDQQSGEMSNNMTLATFAIDHIERIKRGHPEYRKSLLKVAAFVENKLKNK